MNQKGFTLLEMLLVLLVISVLVLLIIPNIVTQHASMQQTGCEALIKSTEAQVQAYQLNHNTMPTIDQLYTNKYIATTTCPNGDSLVINASTGAVSVSNGS